MYCIVSYYVDMIDCFAGKYIIHKLLGSGQRRPRVYSDGTKTQKEKNRHKESPNMKSFFDQSKLLTLFKVWLQSNEIMLVKKIIHGKLAIHCSISFNPPQPFIYWLFYWSLIYFYSVTYNCICLVGKLLKYHTNRKMNK